MLKYSPRTTHTLIVNNLADTILPRFSRHLVNGTSYCVAPYLTATQSNRHFLGGWYVFLSDKTPEEIEPLFISNNKSFEKIRSHGSTGVAFFANDPADLSPWITHNTDGSLTLNIAKMLRVDSKIANSSSGNGGVFYITSGFTCKTVGINFVGGTSNGTNHSDNYFLFTVGDKYSNAEVKIHNPVLQVGDTVDLSDLTLTIQVPLEVE